MTFSIAADTTSGFPERSALRHHVFGMRCPNRHTANEIYVDLHNPATDNAIRQEMRAKRQRLGIRVCPRFS